MSTIYRIHWTPGSDRLLAVCHCDAWRELEDPIAAWEWLLAHPEGHTSGRAGPGADPGTVRPALTGDVGTIKDGQVEVLRRLPE